jgi:hypothetical protein
LGPPYDLPNGRVHISWLVVAGGDSGAPSLRWKVEGIGGQAGKNHVLGLSARGKRKQVTCYRWRSGVTLSFGCDLLRHLLCLRDTLWHASYGKPNSCQFGAWAGATAGGCIVQPGKCTAKSCLLRLSLPKNGGFEQPFRVCDPIAPAVSERPVNAGFQLSVHPVPPGSSASLQLGQ